MPRARLKQLALKGFRSFAEESVIDFPESGMVLFKGANRESKGSSGSGKSSVLLAIAYLLKFCPFPRNALQSWHTQEPMTVRGTFEVDEGELMVARGERLALYLNGQQLKGSAAELETKLDKHMGIGAEMRAALTYRGQKQPGLFLSKTDAEKKEFLTALLDLGRFEVQVEKSQERARKLDVKIAAGEQAVAAAKRNAQMYADPKPAKTVSEESIRLELDGATAEQERLRASVLDLRAKVRNSEAEIERAAQRRRQEMQPRLDALELRIHELREEKPGWEKVDQQRLEEVAADLAQAKEFLAQAEQDDAKRQAEQRSRADSVYVQLMLLEKKLAQRQSLSKYVVELGEQIAAAGQNQCPTCEQEWTGAAAMVQQAREEMAKARQELAGLEKLALPIEQLQREYRELGEFKPSEETAELRAVFQQLQADLAQERANVNARMQVLRAEHERLISDTQAELQRARAGIGAEIERFRHDASSHINNAQIELEELERKLYAAECVVRGVQAQIQRVQIDNAREEERAKLELRRAEEVRAQLQEAQASLEEAQASLGAELDFQRLIGREGFLGAIFDEVLDEISDETNRILGGFPNTSHVTLHFRSESQTQKGTVNKSITPVVSIGGVEAPLKSGLSGGMITAAELAVDLAVATVVSRRTGAVPGWLVLDESFEGLGSVEKEACMDILQGYAHDKLVLVVDHSSEFKEMFAQFVWVEYQGGKSRIAEAVQ